MRALDWLLGRKTEHPTPAERPPASYVYMRGAMVGEVEIGNVDVVIAEGCYHEALPKLKNVGRVIYIYTSFGRTTPVDDNGLEWVT